MSLANPIAFSLTPEELKEVQDALHILETKLLPHLTTLSPSDKRELPKMGDKTVSFVQKAAAYAADNPTLVPGFLDANTLDRDLAAMETLNALAGPLEHLNDAVDDTRLAIGSDAYSFALTFYQASKSAAKNRVHGSQAIYDDLSARFPGRSRKSPADKKTADSE